MKWVAAVTAVALTVVVLRGQLRPPDPRAIRSEPSSPAEDTAVARGKLLYERYGCVMCHGADAKGGHENPNAETEGKIPGLVKVAEGYTEAELVKLIARGTPRIGKADAAGPMPPYRMPGWGDRLTDAELKDLVRYLLSLAPKSKAGSWR